MELLELGTDGLVLALLAPNLLFDNLQSELEVTNLLLLVVTHISPLSGSSKNRVS